MALSGKLKAYAKLKQIPFSQAGVKEVAAIRMVKMAQPICKPCQLEFRGGKGWWNICTKRGHNPYFSTPEPVVETVPIITLQEDGRNLITGHEEVLVEQESRLNLKQVALLMRVNSGQGVERGMERKGYKMLPEVGYAPTCEFRNCFAEIKVETSYGDYCGENHARLVAADVETIPLSVDDVKKKRRQLGAINIYADN